MSQTPTPSNSFQTTDLILAAFLVHEGLSAELYRSGQTGKGHPIGGWCFKEEIERVQQLVIEYNEGKSKVDPKTFYQTVGKVRGTMYDFLGIKRKG